MVVIGVTGGLLFAAGGPWSYPSLLRQLGNVTFGRPASFPVVSIIGPLALIAGGTLAALLGGRFGRHPISAVQLARSASGGAAMGLAASLIPGGNDALLLSGIPSLAFHAPFAAIAMLAVQITALSVAKRWKDRSARAWAASMRARRR